MKKLLVMISILVIAFAYQQVSARDFMELPEIGSAEVGSMSQFMFGETLKYNNQLRESVNNINQRLFGNSYLLTAEEEEGGGDEEKPRSGGGDSVSTNTVLAFVLNFFLPFGIGSFVQGDIGAGTLIAIGEGVSIVLIIVSFILTAATFDPMNPTAFNLTPLLLAIPGYLGLIGFHVYSLIAPWVYKPNGDMSFNLNVTDPEFYALTHGKSLAPTFSMNFTSLKF